VETAISAVCWAKSGDGGREWLSVQQHLADTAAVAARLWDDWLPLAVRRRVAIDLERPASARTLVRLLAGLHDLGKITPAFACQVPALLPPMAVAGLRVDDSVQRRRHELPHALAGGLTLRRWLMDVTGWPAPAADAFAVIVAGHHGRPPSTLADAPAEDLLGTGPWEHARLTTLEQVVHDLGAADEMAGWRRRPPGEIAQVLLSAIVIVADWLASNPSLFPLVNGDVGEARADRAWQTLGLPPPWRPPEPEPADPAFWSSRFSLPAEARPRPVQTAAAAMVHDAAAPGLLVVEAPMGEGKTEAALAAAELLAARCGAGGVMIALPTMATSDAMFRRVLTWLDHLPRPDGLAWSTFLAHGKARLNEDFRGLHTGVLTGVGVDEPAGVAVAHEWLSGRKKGVLSTFVVGTIDQVLVGALRTRHLALRHLALASKVIVLDEVHAADEYMSTYLAGVLAWSKF
jgi:CRISPR-associated endonuclease/helicase Cas3